MPTAKKSLAVELSAVIVSVTKNEPQVLVTPDQTLPSGPFGTQHRTLEQGLRAWVENQSHLRLGYVEQLYTFADKDRTFGTDGDDYRVISIGYLALMRPATESKDIPITTDWYKYFPWEDRRAGVPAITALILRGLTTWKNAATDTAKRREREERIAINFPKDPKQWNEELVLQRYELLWSANLLEESQRAPHKKGYTPVTIPSLAMAHDHRRILATGMARLRAKIKYRPVVFELLPERFTLLQLQGTVEALAGLRLHKQNFRRLVQTQGLVEETSSYQSTVTMGEARGRPAKLFAFRREVLRERAAVGTKLPRSG